MSTVRDRFGVSILVGFVLAVVCGVQAPALAAPPSTTALALAAGDEGMFTVERVMTAASSRTQVAIALGAGVPMLIIGFMVRRRIYADL